MVPETTATVAATATYINHLFNMFVALARDADSPITSGAISRKGLGCQIN
jgi:hypothetical protein